MNISYNWLKRYLKTDLSAEEMATILTDIGLELELRKDQIDSRRTCGRRGRRGADLHGSSRFGPPASDDGGCRRRAPLQIVCGAPNCRQGLKVLCATVGAVLYPNGGEEEFKIKRRQDPGRGVARDALRRGRTGYRSFA